MQWASSRLDPGRSARVVTVRRDEDDREASGRSAGQDMRSRFMARAIVIDCPHSGCSGKYITGAREIVLQAGTGARVVLRCTRNPKEHESKIIVEPYTEKKASELATALQQGNSLTCEHCGTRLSIVKAGQAGDTAGEDSGVYRCSWCGARWRSSATSGPKAESGDWIGV